MESEVQNGLNRRGTPQRKRKKNSLIFGKEDVVVNMPSKSPRKKDQKSSPTKSVSSTKKSPVKKVSPRKSASKKSPASSPRKRVKREKRPSAVKKAIFVGDVVNSEDDENDDEEGSFDEKKNFPEEEMDDGFNPPALQVTPSKLPTNTTTIRPNLQDLLDNLSEPEDTDEEEQEQQTPTKIVSSQPSKRRGQRRTPAKRGSSVSPAKRKSARAASGNSNSTALQGEEPDLTSPEKICAQQLGVALRNLLKLPKAHKWICYEFFYSNLDRVLFEGENDFLVCIRESFPGLKTRRLTRVEWSKIRRMIGKPRRCSAAFFAEERTELARKRQKIRLLQQRKQSEHVNFKDLPDDIPIQISIGTRVTARLRYPQDGLFTGTVDGYDISNSTYRITFDRSGLGTASIPDFEVLSNSEMETVPLAHFTTKPTHRPRPAPVQPAAPSPGMASPYLSPLKASLSHMAAAFPSPQVTAHDPLLSGSTPKGKVMHMDSLLGGYPVRFLDLVVRLSKVLKKKREAVGHLRELNSQGEKQKSFGEFISEDFQRRYASAVIDLSGLNRDLNDYLENIRQYTAMFSNEAGPTVSLPNIIRQGCQEDAYDMVNKNNTTTNAASGGSGEGSSASKNESEEKEYVSNPKILTLISSLTALMIQVKGLAEGEKSAFELEALQESLTEIREGLHPDNAAKFTDNVEVHMQHIQTGVSQLGNLQAFMMRPKVELKQEPL